MLPWLLNLKQFPGRSSIMRASIKTRTMPPARHAVDRSIRPGSQRRGSHLTLLWLALGLLSSGGCVSTIALDRAVVAYDTTVSENVSRQLLLNIARSRHDEPMHFTAISSIAATYSLSLNTGLGPALTGDRGALLIPFIGGSA